jgi:hypothetical protein
MRELLQHVVRSLEVLLLCYTTLKRIDQNILAQINISIAPSHHDPGFKIKIMTHLERPTQHLLHLLQACEHRILYIVRLLHTERQVAEIPLEHMLQYLDILHQNLHSFIGTKCLFKGFAKNLHYLNETQLLRVVVIVCSDDGLADFGLLVHLEADFGKFVVVVVGTLGGQDCLTLDDVLAGVVEKIQLSD